MTKINRAYLELHFAVFLFGFAAILGDLIKVSALSMVWWRILLSVGLFMFYVQVFSEIRRISRSNFLKFLGIGVIISLHWVCFYGSIKLANASVGLICFSATPFFTALVEPFFRKTPWRKVDFIFGLFIVLAMYLIIQSLDFSMYQGVVVGILSSLLAAVFISLNKKYIDVTGPVTILVIEMLGALLFLTLIIPLVYIDDFNTFYPRGIDWVYLICLVLFCTMLSFTLHMRALKYISAFTSNLIISLEPVYGIILAIIILNEHRELNFQFYIGVTVMILLVMIYPLATRR